MFILKYGYDGVLGTDELKTTCAFKAPELHNSSQIIFSTCSEPLAMS